MNMEHILESNYWYAVIVKHTKNATELEKTGFMTYLEVLRNAAFSVL